VSYHAIYLGDVDTAVFQEMARSLTARFESGELTPLPLKTFPLAQAVDAFRFMAQARHIGKIVIVVDESGSRPAVRAEAAYLVTGGHGALGQAVARRLVALGARHLVLAGRTAPSAEAAATIRELEDAGARVVVAQVDVSREAEVSRLLDSITPPLAGIVHAAGALDDGVLAEQTWARFETVLRPKIAGAWHLHRHTAHRPLDFFVMFSSMVSLFGAPGQGNYAAGNAFLDALAHLRRSQGLPALSINWGAWADMGMVAAVAGEDQRRWRQQGFGLIPVENGLAIFERLLTAGIPQAAVLPIDWTTLLQRYAPGAEPALFAEIAAGMKQAGRGAAKAAPRRKLLEELESAPVARRRALAQSRVREEALRVLGLAADATLDVRQPLRELGLDSLMAVELRNTLAESLGRALPATLLFKYPTLEELSGFVLSHLPEPAQADPAPAAAPDESDARELEALSDEEARALLSSEVESIAAAWRDGSPV
jgi:NAD(P)-dependent dehydrogenase (short-subunit alcohol dehydrogenase family)